MPGPPINPIDQTVQTPSFSVGANPFHAEPLESNVGTALAQAGDAFHGIWKVQQDQANAIDVAHRMGPYLAAAGQAKVTALNSGIPGPEMIAKYGKDLTAIRAKTVAGTEDPANPNPPNYAVMRELQLATAQHMGGETGSFPSEAAMKVHEDLARKLPQNINLQVSQIAQDPASFQVLGPDGQPFNPANPDPANQPHWQLTSKGMDRLAIVQNLTHGATTGMPDQEQFWNNYAAQHLVRQHAMNIAMDPTLAPHIKAFLNAPENAAILTPEEHGQALNASNNTMLEPQRELEIQGKAVQAQNEKELLAAKAGGTLTDATVIASVNAFKVPREFGEQLIEKQIEPQTNPATFNAVRANLDAAGTPEEIEMNLAGVGTPGSGVNSTDAAKLRAYGAGLKPVLNDPLKAADRLYGGAKGWIAQQYRATDMAGAVMNPMDPMVKNNSDQAQNYYDTYSAIVAQGKAPAEAVEAKRVLAEKATKLYPMPPGFMVKPETRAKVMAIPPHLIMPVGAAVLRGESPPPVKFDPNSGGVPPMGVAR